MCVHISANACVECTDVWCCVCAAGGLCSLTIDKALPEDEGQYKCRAENSAGKAECSCMVLVDGKTLILNICLYLHLHPASITVGI